jgi:hypothetical protein
MTMPMSGKGTSSVIKMTAAVSVRLKRQACAKRSPVRFAMDLLPESLSSIFELFDAELFVCRAILFPLSYSSAEDSGKQFRTGDQTTQ